MNLAKYFLLGLLVMLLANDGKAQWTWDSRLTVDEDGVFMGGLGVSSIDGETFFAFRMRTELTFGQFGLGIDVPLRFGAADGRIRDEDWNSAYDVARALRYVRYGQKWRSPVYARAGTLESAQLGHGFIMSYYTNEAEYDNRKIGLEFDLRQDVWGAETVLSNFERVEIIGGRAFVRPLRNVEGIGLLGRISLGATVVSDRKPDPTGATRDHITIGGVDIELPLLYRGPFFSHIYADYAKIQSFGSGQAIGLELGLWKLSGVLTLRAKLERRFLGRNFLPSYFDAFYEIERFQNTANGPVRKSDLLLQRTSSKRGIYGELFGNVANFVQMVGTLETIDGLQNSGKLHLAAALSRSIARISARAIYDKTGIEDFADAFTLDERSLARLGLGYQVNSFLHFYVDYVWTFQRNETTGLLESQRRIEPHLALVVPLRFGGQARSAP